MKIDQFTQEKINRWTLIRRDIHAHPELKYEEERTAALVASKLNELGYEVVTGLGKTGVAGVITGTRPTQGRLRTIGLRADMDALPIQEKNDFSHRSTHDGKMHACGHDGHTAILLALAEELSQNRNFEGRVVLIFQPAEEGGGGARAMIEDGLLDRFPLDAIFALHNWPGLEEGSAAIHAGPVMASSNEFKIKIKGRGCHAAMPDLGIDPILIGAQLVTALQTIISRNKRPVDAAVISVTQFNAGNTINVIPETAELKGTVRTFDPKVLDLVEEKLKSTADLLCRSMGAEAEVNFVRAYPATINDKGLARWMAQSLSNSLPQLKVYTDLDPTMGAEDFAFFLEKVPGVYFWLGNGDGGHREAGHGLGPCMLHNPSYDFNDRLLPHGVQIWMKIIEQFFNTPDSELFNRD